MTTRVLVNGVFDGLHPGHLAHLQAAAKLGDHLIVALTADEYVNKGPGQPLFTWTERCDMLKALRFVNSVVMSYSGEEAIRFCVPDIFAKGIEYQGKLDPKILQLCEDLGVKISYLDTKPVYSSTYILTGGMLRDRIERGATARDSAKQARAVPG